LGILLPPPRFPLFLNHPAYSLVRLQILHAISFGQVSEYMYEIHKFQDMPSDFVNPTLVYLLHLKPYLHPRKQAFYLCLRLGVYQVANEYLCAQGIDELETVTVLWVVPINLR